MTEIFSQDCNMESTIPSGSTATENNLYCSFVSKGPTFQKTLFPGFNLASVTVEQIMARIRLRLVNDLEGGSNANFLCRVRRVRRTNITHNADWTTYDGTNPWGTAGAENTSTDVYTDNQFSYRVPVGSETPGTVTIIEDAGLKAMALAAKADDGILRLLIEPDPAETIDGGQLVSADSESLPPQPESRWPRIIVGSGLSSPARFMRRTTARQAIAALARKRGRR
ncbi:MAG: hypothetical protein L0Y44_07730 [Phycisphaerales bacterium]|nr:hypothetical protein [Phycisphaerales bacterium]MCI0676111.1 hypothetical protein [Phycisphaerales bacterium]